MDYVIIAGASIDNLGAESMTCIAIKIAEKLVPNAKIILASTDKAGMQKKVKYKVCLYRFPNSLECHKNNLIGNILCETLNAPDDEYYRYILPNTKYILDISGYSFTSKFGIDNIYEYLNRVYIAKCYKIKMLILPQSFGPLDFTGIKEHMIMDFLIHHIMQYPQIIFAREKTGYRCMRQYVKRNLKYCPDLVLTWKSEIDYSVLRRDIAWKQKNVIFDTVSGKRKVAIIPNQKIMEKTLYGNKYIQILKDTIVALEEKNVQVYIVIHCGLDKEICDALCHIMRKFVITIDCTEYGATMYDQIIDKFDFVIASRYHAIVHAYRHMIPAVALGWADKYNELLETLDQTQFLLDCREGLERENVLKVVETMLKDYRTVKEKLTQNMKELWTKYGK